jgi:hypothetical protein
LGFSKLKFSTFGTDLYRFKKVLFVWVGTLALKRPQAAQASQTAEGSRPYLPQ